MGDIEEPRSGCLFNQGRGTSTGPCAPRPRSWTTHTPICGLAQGLGPPLPTPHPRSLEVHLLGVTKAVLGRQHSDWQGGCLVPALGAPAGLRDMRPRRKCSWEEVIWGTRLTSDLAGLAVQEATPSRPRTGCRTRSWMSHSRSCQTRERRWTAGVEPCLSFPACEDGVQRCTPLV